MSLTTHNSLNIPLNSQYHYQQIPQIERIFFKSAQIRDFQEINMKPQISDDSEWEVGNWEELLYLKIAYL